jgi:hypothetical protein
MEAGTAAPEQTGATLVVFVSKDQNLRLVKDPADERLAKDGRRVPVPGKTFEFKKGELVVDASDSEALEFLRGHDANGSNPNASDASETLFVERGNEPDRPASGDASDVLRKVVDLAVARDADGLADVYLAERSSQSRPEVLAAIEEAIEKLDGEVPAPPQAPEHEVERVRAQPAVGDTPGVQPLTQPAVEGQSVNPAEPVAPTEPVQPGEEGHPGPLDGSPIGEPAQEQPAEEPPAEPASEPDQTG